MFPSGIAILEHMENALTVHSLITKYLAWCGQHRSPRTLEWYTGHLDKNTDFLKKVLAD